MQKTWTNLNDKEGNGRKGFSYLFYLRNLWVRQRQISLIKKMETRQRKHGFPKDSEFSMKKLSKLKTFCCCIMFLLLSLLLLFCFFIYIYFLIFIKVLMWPFLVLIFRYYEKKHILFKLLKFCNHSTCFISGNCMKFTLWISSKTWLVNRWKCCKKKKKKKEVFLSDVWLML